jgi:hypothetical protein
LRDRKKEKEKEKEKKQTKKNWKEKVAAIPDHTSPPTRFPFLLLPLRKKVSEAYLGGRKWMHDWN